MQVSQGEQFLRPCQPTPTHHSQCIKHLPRSHPHIRIFKNGKRHFLMLQPGRQKEYFHLVISTGLALAGSDRRRHVESFCLGRNVAALVWNERSKLLNTSHTIIHLFLVYIMGRLNKVWNYEIYTPVMNIRLYPDNSLHSTSLPLGTALRTRRDLYIYVLLAIIKYQWLICRYLCLLNILPAQSAVGFPSLLSPSRCLYSLAH